MHTRTLTDAQLREWAETAASAADDPGAFIRLRSLQPATVLALVQEVRQLRQERLAAKVSEAQAQAQLASLVDEAGALRVLLLLLAGVLERAGTLTPHMRKTLAPFLRGERPRPSA